jgi:hypothetical protein
MMRIELLMGKTNLLQETITQTEVSLHALLMHPGKVLFKRHPMLLKNKALAGYLEIGWSFCHAGADLKSIIEDYPKERKQFASNAQILTEQKGTLSLRMISARNLVDVDLNGEQDPYAIARIAPEHEGQKAAEYGTSTTSSCQTGISLNGGLHPRWNSQVFSLSVADALMDIINFDVLDSNEEDHQPDAFIGGLTTSLYGLFLLQQQQQKEISNQKEEEEEEEEEQPQSSTTSSVMWIESWFPLYTRSSNSMSKQMDFAGEIRVEFRFVEADLIQTSNEPPNPFVNYKDTQGILYCQVIQAQQLTCTNTKGIVSID